jgi:hypothetical protein
MWNIY